MKPIKTVIHKLFRTNEKPVVESNSSKWLRRATSVVSPRRRRSQKSKSLRSMKSGNAAPRIPSLQYDGSTPFDEMFTPLLTSSKSADTRASSSPGTSWTPWSGARTVNISRTKTRDCISRCSFAQSNSSECLSPISFWEDSDVADDDLSDDKEWFRDRKSDNKVDMNSLFWRKVIHDILQTSGVAPTLENNALLIHV